VRAFTQHDLLNRAADYFAQARKPRAEWKKLDDLAAQLAEFDLRCTVGDCDTATSVLTEIDFDYLLLWGHYHLMIDLHERLQGKINDSTLASISTGNLGLAYWQIGQIQKSLQYTEQILSHARRNKNKKHESAALGNLGSAYYYLGDIQKAIKYYEQALEIDRSQEGDILGNLGEAHYSQGDAHKAIEFYKQALVIKREAGDHRVESYLLEYTGHALLSLLDYERARQDYNQSIHISDDISFSDGQLNARWGLAQAYLFQNDLVSARATIEAALQFDVPMYNHNATTLYGIIALRQGERTTAQEAFTKSIAQADEILAKTPDYYSALDAKGLALCGRVLSGEWKVGSERERDEVVAEAVKTFKRAREIAPHAGVVKSVLRLFDELVKCDEEGILQDVRKAVEGVEQ
jgi:tetratricopeptide (TPR) repeat protein